MITLVEAAKSGTGTVLQQTVVELFARNSDFLLALPFENIDGNAVRYTREGSLGSAAFRGVGEGYTESTGSVDPVVDALTICGGDCDVDKFVVDTEGMGSRAKYLAMKVKSLAQTWATKMIKGAVAADPREFDGLQVRAGTGAQRIAAGNTANGDPLSLALLDAAIDAVDGATHLMMSKAMRRRFTAAARTTSVSGNIQTTQDAFGRPQTLYAGLPILVPYANNGGTEPLAFDEACPGGGTSTGTSIYVVALGPGKLQGIQNGGIQVRDLGELEGKPVYRTRIEWYAGLKMEHTRAVARLWGISNAAITA
jgi:hypothetical protein